MSQIRFLVTQEHTADASGEATTSNTFYLDTDELGTDPDYDALASDAANLWAGTVPRTTAQNRIRVRAYDLADAEPRPIRGESIVDWSATAEAPGPSEVALCLSYFAGRNLPRLRGRMYIGPWRASAMAARPAGPQMGPLASLAAGISALGGVNVQWVQYSPSSGEFTNVSDWWVDNAWDTQRRRGLSATSRQTGTVDG